MEMRVVIVDDHPIFRDGLRRILEDYGHAVVAECSDGLEAVEVVRSRRPDLVLMDLQLPGQDGIAALRALGRVPPVVILTVSEEEQDMQEAMNAGACAYLLKNTDASELVRMIETVGEGYRIFPSDPPRRETAGAPTLSDRQKAVLEGLVRGLTLKEIAQDLQISQFTVRTYQERLLEKFGVGSRAELIFAASGQRRPRPS